ncbi:MAG: hypothetical protein H6898_02920 [Rhodobacter sp.]|nr:hypothetical protein [Paracoccaceae bacterium]MCC0075524.1 hypothetical protein [Rhodobacter sp.]
MFDWDSDYEGVVETKVLARAGETGNGFIRGILTRWVAPLAVVAGLSLAGSLTVGTETGRFLSASLGQAGAFLFGTRIEEPPADLIAYGPEQFHNFMRGVAGFSNEDLLTFAAVTQRGLGDLSNPSTPFMLDVLFLTYREIERRGMARPVAWMAVQEARDSYLQTANLEL